MSVIEINIPNTVAGYETFIRCKKLPTYTVRGRTVVTDDISYATVFGGNVAAGSAANEAPHLMKFQSDVVDRALAQRRFAIFADCGLGKTPMALAWAHAVAKGGKVLILAPLAVRRQWHSECQKFHGHRLIDLRDGDSWTDGIAILNYESMRDIDMRDVRGIVLDESSILKNEQGQTRDWLCALSENVPYRLAASATPAPNDHAEYASHAVFLGYARTAKEFFSQFFRKDGVKWVLRGHAIGPFYRNLSTWSTYIHSPRALGYTDSTEMGQEPDYIERWCKLPDGWKLDNEALFASASNSSDRAAVFGSLRSTPGPRLSAIAEELSGKRGIVWCSRNAEEDAIRGILGGSVAVINGQMPIEERVEKVDAFRSGQLNYIVSKPKVLGFGVNIPECDHMVYSGFNDSFEEMYQAVRRAHRYGRVGRLRVVLPYTDPEAATLYNLRAKVARFSQDVAEMQSRFWPTT